MVKVLIMMADYGHDPTETAVPYTTFKKAGLDVNFATEAGKSPECDVKMLRGVTQTLLGANSKVVQQYDAMTASDEWKHPMAWTAPDLTLDSFDLVFLPGGHDKAVSQIIDSGAVHKLLVDFYPKTRKPSHKAIGAVCHGVMVLSNAKTDNGKSVLHGCVTTALPARFEQLAYWGTRAFLGDYYKTYGAGSEDVEVSVRKQLADPSHFKCSLLPTPFVVEDDSFNYISARFPGDVGPMAERLVKLVQRS
ncbi:hypothetical protein ACO1O0_006075 [Amphichorda felina]